MPSRFSSETLSETLGHKKRADSALFTRPNRQFVWCGRCAIVKVSTGFHRCIQNQVNQGEFGIFVTIGFHRFVQKETLGETLGDAGHKKRGRQLSLPFFVVRLWFKCGLSYIFVLLHYKPFKNFSVYLLHYNTLLRFMRTRIRYMFQCVHCFLLTISLLAYYIIHVLTS